MSADNEMAFLRFTRDKRGYEQFSLVEPTTNRRGKSRSRLLYWYRTPPNVRVGREPFDESVRRALETQNPDVQFDWRKIVETPIPSADTEHWRERRRVEKAERAARRAIPVDDELRAEPETRPDIEIDETAPDVVSESVDFSVEGNAPTATADNQQPPVADRAIGDVAGRRRRRRGRRARQSAPPAAADVKPAASDSEPEGE